MYARLIADEALAGKPLVRIARMLNEHGVPAPRGGLWQVGTLSQLLRAPAFAGLLPETQMVWDEDKCRLKYTSVVKPYRDADTGAPVVVGDGIVTVQEQDVIVAALASRTRASTRGDRMKFPAREPAHLRRLSRPGTEGDHRPVGSQRCARAQGAAGYGGRPDLGDEGGWPRSTVRPCKAASY